MTPEESLTRGLCFFFHRNPGLLTGGVLRRILSFFNTDVAPKHGKNLCGLVCANRVAGQRVGSFRVALFGRIEDESKVVGCCRYGYDEDPLPPRRRPPSPLTLG